MDSRGRTRRPAGLKFRGSFAVLRRSARTAFPAASAAQDDTVNRSAADSGSPLRNKRLRVKVTVRPGLTKSKPHA